MINQEIMAHKRPVAQSGGSGAPSAVGGYRANGGVEGVMQKTALSQGQSAEEIRRNTSESETSTKYVRSRE